MFPHLQPEELLVSHAERLIATLQNSTSIPQNVATKQTAICIEDPHCYVTDLTHLVMLLVSFYRTSIAVRGEYQYVFMNPNILYWVKINIH